MGRDVGRVVGVDLDRPEVGFLEVDEEARDKDCCEAVIAICEYSRKMWSVRRNTWKKERPRTA